MRPKHCYRFDSMVKKSKKHHKKVKKVKNKDAAVTQTLPAEKGHLTQNVPNSDNLRGRVEVQPMCNPILLWNNCRSENISRTPGASIRRNETSSECKKAFFLVTLPTFSYQ